MHLRLGDVLVYHGAAVLAGLRRQHGSLGLLNDENALLWQVVVYGLESLVADQVGFFELGAQHAVLFVELLDAQEERLVFFAKRRDFDVADRYLFDVFVEFAGDVVDLTLFDLLDLHVNVVGQLVNGDSLAKNSHHVLVTWISRRVFA